MFKKVMPKLFHETPCPSKPCPPRESKSGGDRFSCPGCGIVSGAYNSTFCHTCGAFVHYMCTIRKWFSFYCPVCLEKLVVHTFVPLEQIYTIVRIDPKTGDRHISGPFGSRVERKQ